MTCAALYSGFHYFVNGDNASRYLSEKMGKDIEIESLNLSLFPRPAVKLVNVRYDNKKDYEIKFKKIYVGFSFDNTFSLDKIKIKYLSLVGSDIILHKKEKNSVLENYSRLNIPDLYIHDISYENSILDIKKLSIKEFKGIKNININGNVDFRKKNPYFDVNLDVAKSDIKKIAKKFAIKLPKFESDDSLKNISASLKIGGDQKRLILKDSIINIDDVTIAMRASVKNLDISSMESRFYIKKVDLNKYMTAESKKSDSGVGYFDVFKGIIHSSKITVEELKVKDTDISNISFILKIKNNLIDINPVTFKIYGGAFKAFVKIDISRQTPKFKIKQEIISVDIAELFTENEQFFKGKVDISSDISYAGVKKDDMIKTLRGRVKIYGRNVILVKYDLDEIISQYEKTKSVGLLDITAIYLLGPFAGLVTQSAKFAVLKNELENSSESKIEEIYSLWEIKYSIAKAKDVALKTKNNIIVLKGAIDLQTKDLINIEVAVLDKRRCAEYKQELVGNLETIDIAIRESALESFIAPVFTILSGTKNIFTNKCKPYYDGRIKW